MDYELIAITRAARSVTIRLIEGRYHMFVYNHSGFEYHYVGPDLPSLIHRVHDDIML